MSQVTEHLEQLVSVLERMVSKEPADAIAAELTAPPRTSAVRSLRNDEVVQQFRQELVDGLIRVDTANRLLALVSQVIGMIGPLR
ncbi:MAG TPA: hypothetical protein VGM03_21490 [Phycisphaerae bacterium]|jgi:hypothetical protein